MGDIKIVGMEKLQKKLKKNVSMDAVKRVVRHNGAEMQEKAQRNTEQFKGYQNPDPKKRPTGTLKRSIGLEITDDGMSAEVEPTAEYAPYVELGTRFMEAQPYLKPAFNVQKEKFKKDMNKLVE